MRTFLAIDLPEEVRAELARRRQTFREVCRDARWTRPESIHLTLKFLGEISEAQVGGVTKALEEFGNLTNFPLEVRGFGFFPDARRPRVFWTGVRASNELAALVGRIEEAMEKLGFAREQRAFNPHLTLARFPSPRPQPQLTTLVESQKEATLGRFNVSDFFLFESELSPAGARYSKIGRFGAGT